MYKLVFVFLISMLSVNVFSIDSAEYTGKIKSLYSHERGEVPYFTIEIEGSMSTNPCRENGDLKHFIKKPNDVSSIQMSMLLAAFMADKTVVISSSATTDDEECFNHLYPTFNFVQIKKET